MSKEIIYLDYAATTPVDDRVIKAMLPYLGQGGLFANSESNHLPGKLAKSELALAKQTLLTTVNATSHDLVWTSGGTESNNLALKGLFNSVSAHKFSHIITCKTEHKAVLEPIRYLEQQGIDVTYLLPSQDGLIDLKQLEDALSKKPALVSIMWVNNETGVIQDINEIAKLTKKYNSIFHCDAAQAFGKLKIDLDAIPIDLLSISGHKIYAPKGIGGLILCNSVLPIMHGQIQGGNQQNNLRSGTLPVPQIIAFSKSAEIAYAELDITHKHNQTLSELLIKSLSEIPATAIHGSYHKKLCNIFNISFDCVNSKVLQKNVCNKLAISLGSACNSESIEPSYVLKAMGLTDDQASTAIRISFGKYTTREEICTTVAILKEAVGKIRQQSKLWRLKNSNLYVNACLE